MKFLILVTVSFVFTAKALAWGELGHHLVGRLGGKLVASHPLLAEKKQKHADSFLYVFNARRIMFGHLGNIPDTHWRSYDGGLKEDVSLLGDPTHFLDSEVILNFESQLGYSPTKIPLDYERAKALVRKDKPKVNFFKTAGSLPWRAQQFASLYEWAVKNYPKQSCADLAKAGKTPTRDIQTYAGLLTHFTADASMPLHATVDFDGEETGQKGMHWYFENDLVDELESAGLEEQVAKRALLLITPQSVAEPHAISSLRARARELYPESEKTGEVAALMLVLLADSLQEVEVLRKLDEKYALASFAEAREKKDCKELPAVKMLVQKFGQAKDTDEKAALSARKIKSEGKSPACRRLPATLVDEDGAVATSRKAGARSVAQWHELLIVERLALSTALTADIWTRLWIKAGEPELCYTWDYALKPAFISPTDPKCFGYALKEGPGGFLKKNNTSATPWKKAAKKTGDCLSL